MVHSTSHPSSSEKFKKNSKQKNVSSVQEVKILEEKPSEKEAEALKKEGGKGLKKSVKDASKPSEKEEGKVKKRDFYKKKSFRGVFWFLGISVLVLMSALYWEASEEKKQKSLVPSGLSSLESDQENIELRLKKLEENQLILTEQMKRTSVFEKDLVQYQGEMAALNARLNALENDIHKTLSHEEAAHILRRALPEQTQTNQKIAQDATQLRQLEARVGAIEKSLLLKRQLSQKGAEVIQVFSNLQQAALTGLSFEEELKAFSKEINQDSSQVKELLEILKPFASCGVSTPIDLYLVFPTLADNISSTLQPEPKNFWQKILRRIKSLVSIRRVDNISLEDTSLEGNLVKMESILSHGDLKRTVEMLKDLDARAQAVSAVWMENAQNYLNVQAALQGLRMLLVESPFREMEELKAKKNREILKKVSQ